MQAPAACFRIFHICNRARLAVADNLHRKWLRGWDLNHTPTPNKCTKTCWVAHLASTAMAAPVVTEWVEGNSGWAGLLSRGVQVGTAGCAGSPCLHQEQNQMQFHSADSITVYGPQEKERTDCAVIASALMLNPCFPLA